MSERVLGLDYGSKRVGLALSDPTGTIASPVGYADAQPRKALVARLRELCREKGVCRLVMGLPRSLDGHEGPAAQAARELGEDLAAKLALPIEYLDERLSSVSAERALLEGDVSRKQRKQKIDSVAAAVILQNWLDREQGGGPVIPPMPEIGG